MAHFVFRFTNLRTVAKFGEYEKCLMQRWTTWRKKRS